MKKNDGRISPAYMSRRRRIYEGKAKVLYEGPEPGTLIQHFKDDATAFNAKKHEVIEGKGVLNNRISEYVFQHLNDIGVPTHFIRRLNMIFPTVAFLSRSPKWRWPPGSGPGSMLLPRIFLPMPIGLARTRRVILSRYPRTRQLTCWRGQGL